MLIFKQGVQKWVRHGSIWRIAHLGISNALQSGQRPLLRQTLPAANTSFCFLFYLRQLYMSRIQGRPVGLKCLVALSAPGPFGFKHVRDVNFGMIWFDLLSWILAILYASPIFFSYSLKMITILNYDYHKKCHKLLTNLSSDPSSPVACEIMRGCDSATPTLQLYKDQCCITACSWNLAARKWSKGKEGLESAYKIL